MRHLIALVALALSSSTLADPQPATLPELQAAIAAKDHQIVDLGAQLEAAKAAVAEADRALTDHEASMQAPLALESRLAQQLTELDDYLYVTSLPAEIARVLPDRRARHAELLQSVQNRRRDAENLRLAGLEPDPQLPAAEAMEQLLAGNLAYLEALDAALRDGLPTLRPPSFLQQGANFPLERSLLVNQLRDATAQLAPLRERRAALLHELRGRSAARDATKERHLAAQRERHQFLFQLATRFDPPAIRSIRVEAPWDPRAGERAHYVAVYADPEAAAENAAAVQFLLDGIPAVSREIELRRQAFVDAENRFVAVADRWQQAHERYATLLSHAYYWQIGTEVTDSLLGVVKDGAEPAAVLFELGWRVGEAFLANHHINEPAVADSLLEYRAALAQRLSGADGAEPATMDDEGWLLHQRVNLEHRGEFFRPTSERAWEDLSESQVGEIPQFVVGLGITGVKEFADWAAHNKRGPQTLVQFLDTVLFKEVLWGTKPSELPAAVGDGLGERIARWLRTGDATEEVIKGTRARAGKIAKDVASGIAFTVAITAAKDAVKAPNEEERIRVSTELVLLDVEWLLRRAEYQARGRIYYATRAALAGVEASIGELIEERATIADGRSVNAPDPADFATAEPLRVVLEFTHPVTQVSIAAGGKTFEQDVRNLPQTAIDIPALSFEEGPVTLAISATGANGLPLDADSNTLALFDQAADLAAPAATLFKGYEQGPCRTHRVTLVKPTIAIVSKKGGYTMGDWIDFHYTLPGSLPFRAIDVTAVPMEKPVSTRLAAVREGDGQFQVPPRLGQFRLYLFDTRNPAPLAEEAFAVAPVLARDLPAGEYSHAWIAPLSDRGNQFPVITAPIPEGKGRMLFDRRDAGAQLIGTPYVSVRAHGGKDEITGTWSNSIDLPPDTYDLRIGYAVPVERTGVVVTAGQTTPVSVAGLGRLTYDRRDGAGEATTAPYASVRLPGQDQEVWGSWHSSVDLPPGTYDVRFGYAIPITHRGVVVEAGQESTIRCDGYGRLVVNRTDGQGHSPRFDVRRSGTKDVVTTSWDAFVDIPPGTYDIYVYNTEAEKHGVTVVAGRAQTVEVNK